MLVQGGGCLLLYVEMLEVFEASLGVLAFCKGDYM